MSWAVVLGTSSGTGEAAALRLVEEPGLHIFGVHRGNHPDGVQAVAQAAEASGRLFVDHRCDASLPDEIEAAALALLQQAGPRSVRLVLHAIASASVGTLIAGPEPHLVPRQFQRTFDKMAHSFVWWVQALHRHELLAPGAHVLGLTNPIGQSLIRGTAAITASKAALTAYMRHLAFELGPQGVRVNLLDFGMVESPATQATFDHDLARVDQIVRRVTPVGRKVRIEQVADLIALLAGDRLAWFNGAVIDFTGGEMLAHYDALVHDKPL